MKFTNAILSLATIGTINSLNNNNNHHVVVDAKSWSLRGLIGRSTNTNNNNDVTRSLLKDVEEEGGSRGEKNLPTPTANLEGLSINQQQGGRRLKKNDKKDKDEGGKKGKNKGDETATAEVEDEGGKKKKESKKGKKDEKIGKEVFAEAPRDAQERHAACDDTEAEEVGRRILGSKGNKDKEVMDSGMCDSCTKEEGTPEEAEASGLSVEVETSDNQTCNPDDTTSCEEDSGVGEDPTIELPEEATEEVNEEEEVARRELMERRLTGDTRNIGQFSPLTCNPVEFDCTAAAGLSTVVGEGEVVVPCGTCLVVSVISDSMGGIMNYLFNCLIIQSLTIILLLLPESPPSLFTHSMI